jgi:hypothetical protein
VPVGYGLAVLALPVFGLFGILDYVWHTVFGIEQEFKILFSPTHLVGRTAMVLIVTSPLRAAWADRRLPAAPSLRQTAAGGCCRSRSAPRSSCSFLQVRERARLGPALDRLHVLGADRPWRPAAGRRTLSAAIVVTNLVLLAPLLLLVRRWRVPVGTADDPVRRGGRPVRRRHRRSGTRRSSVTMVLAGALVDVLLARLAPREDRRGALPGVRRAGPAGDAGGVLRGRRRRGRPPARRGRVLDRRAGRGRPTRPA